MLRSGKKINIESNELVSNNGVILAPIINIHGLVLRANVPIPLEIKDFLGGEGVKISRVRYQDELYVIITGCYQIDKSRVQEFIKQNWELTDKEKASLYTVSPATNLQSEISEYTDQVSQGNKLKAKFENQEFTGMAGTFHAVKYLTISAGGTVYNQGRLVTERDMDVSAKEQIHTGKMFVEGRFGFFAECKANRNASFEGKINATNAIFDSGNKLKFEGDSLSIGINTAITWGNSPSPDLHRLGG